MFFFHRKKTYSCFVCSKLTWAWLRVAGLWNLQHCALHSWNWLQDCGELFIEEELISNTGMENKLQLRKENELLLPSWMVLAGLDRFAKLRPSSPLVFLLLCLQLDRRRWNPVVTFIHYFLYPVCVLRLSVLFRREALRLSWIPTLQVIQ